MYILLKAFIISIMVIDKRMLNILIESLIKQLYITIIYLISNIIEIFNPIFYYINIYINKIKIKIKYFWLIVSLVIF